jgi:hypothetical protein
LYVPAVALPGLAQEASEASRPESAGDPDELPELEPEPDDDPDEPPLEPPEEDPLLDDESSLLASGLPLLLLLEHAAAAITNITAAAPCVVRRSENAVRSSSMTGLLSSQSGGKCAETEQKSEERTATNV